MKNQLTPKQNLWNEIQTLDTTDKERFYRSYCLISELERECLSGDDVDTICNRVIRHIRITREFCQDNLTENRLRLMKMMNISHRMPSRPMRHKHGVNDAEFAAWRKQMTRHEHAMAVINYYQSLEG